MIGKQTRSRATPFRLPLILSFLLLLTGFAQAETTRQALESALVLSAPSQANVAADPVYAFYAAREFRPAWSGTPRAEEDAALVAQTLAGSEAEGLTPADYAATAKRWPAPPEPGIGAAAYEISLTQDLLRYAHDVRLGRTDPKTVYPDVALPARSFDAAAALNQALSDGTLGDFLAALPPPHAGYRGLVVALAHYRAIDEAGGWPQMRARPPAQMLLRRLAQEDAALTTASASTDEELRQAVMRFQARNGLQADGRVGADTLAALNVPARTRIGQIIANMERWRWLPRQFEDRTVRVNVPDQLVRYYRGDEVLLTSRVAVGKPTSRTPITRMVGASLVTNPPWEVPDDIARASILPKLRQDPSYLVDHDMVLVDGPPGDPYGLSIDWSGLKGLPYHINQQPSETSAMGVMMLDSPNDFGVYLHDTPGKGVFLPAARQKSNGCVRVQEMAKLAALIFSDGERTQVDTLDQAVASGATERLALTRPVPVYLLYWTAIADADGNAGFRTDFYGRDKPLLAALGSDRNS